MEHALLLVRVALAVYSLGIYKMRLEAANFYNMFTCASKGMNELIFKLLFSFFFSWCSYYTDNITMLFM